MPEGIGEPVKEDLEIGRIFENGGYPRVRWGSERKKAAFH
ncbi:hypothetical protein RHECNPAF_5730012 [Rhizobium etli CNPAF512]|nr:hypothetical protein RHECNPAF_5730012 [Rhizobium etli CNPAF512]